MMLKIQLFAVTGINLILKYTEIEILDCNTIFTILLFLMK